MEDPAELPPEKGVDLVRKAQDLCVRQLTVRARSREELRQAMTKREIPEEVAELVLGRLDRAGLLDDAAFAEEWVRSRHTHRGLSRRALVAELRRKGVADSVAAEAASAVDEEDERERARELVRKRMGSLGSVDETTKLRRLVGVLARKGYSEGLAIRVVREELGGADGAAEFD
ncbi:regulatory protein RecX [Kutzneria viridogrisea]|uniref:regulatory protein RecX n=1 Tax=Kutzneria TaxID=43356 RepID=UPI0011DCF109|nr:regulatory protein RecX [Kutzneria albida]